MKKLAKIIFILFIAVFFNIKNDIFVLGQTENASEINELNKQIQENKDKIKRIQEQQEAYSKAIRDKQEEKADLQNQLSILDNRLAKAELDISGTQIEIERAKLEINKTDLEIVQKNQEIDKEKGQIEVALRLIQKQDKVGTLEVLLLNNSLTAFLNQVKYLEDLNKELGESLASLKDSKEKLEEEKKTLVEKNKELSRLKTDFEDKKIVLESDKENKNSLLDQTKSSEKEYQRLLAQAKEEQRAASSDIASLEKKIRSKMTKEKEEQLESNDKGLAWPVPKNVITSYFHDPEYPFKYIFEHPAIDVRAGQGTPIKAAASGYVARAKDAGLGYSYIMLIHGNGLSTVYGHVSKIYVGEEDYVVQGQVIGLSGGMPGTPGAGKLTTGSHLHLEVRSNGIPVNPLEYLP